MLFFGSQQSSSCHSEQSVCFQVLCVENCAALSLSPQLHNNMNLGWGRNDAVNLLFRGQCWLGALLPAAQDLHATLEEQPAFSIHLQCIRDSKPAGCVPGCATKMPAGAVMHAQMRFERGATSLCVCTPLSSSRSQAIRKWNKKRKAESVRRFLVGLALCWI